MRKLTTALAAALAAALLVGAFAGAAEAAGKREFVVAYEAGALKAAKKAVKRNGGKVLRTNREARLLLVRAGRGFRAALRSSRAIRTVVRNRKIGTASPVPKPKRERERVEQEGRAGGAKAGPTVVAEPDGDLVEPLADWQWDMQMIGATADGTYASQPGDAGVTVAVIDTGIDASHPDIAPNLDVARSRNWTEDKEDIDGACADDPDGSCTDPATVDEDGHGTHVAGTIASPINGFGMAGVAPNVTLVNDRAGQDSGYFFLYETIAALDYAGEIGADVANMSFYTDPWNYNCPAGHPALTPGTTTASDTATQQAEQQQVLDLVQGAVDRALAADVTLVAAAGNAASDLDGDKLDETSPDYPEGSEQVRLVSDWCRDMPTEADGVISVSAIGPSKAKADYSNYGAGQETGGTGDDPAGEIDVAAPGGYFRDYVGTDQFQAPRNEILGPYPRNVAEANKEIGGSGKPKSEFVVRDCSPAKEGPAADPSPQPRPQAACAYYQLIQGTSMASPHAAGVAALIVSQFGEADPVHGGLTMDPAAVRERLRATATDTPCPTPATVSYENVGRPASWTATCLGTAAYNGFYGDGIVDAAAAIAE